MMVASWDLQKAIYQHLRNDDAIKAELGTPARIYDDPPPGAVFPYLTLGETRASDWKGVDGGVEHELKLYVFSRYAGRREVKRILSAVYDALHETALTLPDHELVNLRFVFGDVFRRQDGETYQGVARFRAVTHEKEIS
ncbi:DUF3168 domain-containing protein [Hyphococcus formosus]|uniref:DUF3168 domain-containing protein n=1 Tax=Hyphococcus formosus TaxID=3143534 RepID=UPI00398B9DB9